MTSFRVRDKAGVVHRTESDIDKAGLKIGVPASTSCLRRFVAKHWKGYKHFKIRTDVESMTYVTLALTCMTCIDKEADRGA